MGGDRVRRKRKGLLSKVTKFIPAPVVRAQLPHNSTGAYSSGHEIMAHGTAWLCFVSQQR